MEADEGGPRFGEALHILFRVYDHQVHIQGLSGLSGDSFHHRKSEGNIGHESAVHDVQME